MPFALVEVVGLAVLGPDVALELVAVVPFELVAALTVVGLGLAVDGGAT